VLERGLGLCQAAAILTWFPSVAAALGYAYTLSGRVLEAFPLLQQAVAQDTSRGIGAGHARRVAYLSEAYALAGRIEEAVGLAASALGFARTLKARGNEAYALWLHGEIHAQQEPLAGAAIDSYYQPALNLADELGMRPLQAHCHRGLGTLYLQAGQSEQARAALATALDMYRDMEMTFWLPETEAALAEVEGR
jgi:tetratricopeptide (TPR) repeat protein